MARTLKHERISSEESHRAQCYLSLDPAWQLGDGLLSSLCAQQEKTGGGKKHGSLLRGI